MRALNHDLPVKITLDVIGGKWKPLIIYHLEKDTMRFSQLKNVISGITQKMLTAQLREMEKDRIVARKVYAQVPPKVEYSLTEYGLTLKPILHSMCTWGEKHQERKNR